MDISIENGIDGYYYIPKKMKAGFNNLINNQNLLSFLIPDPIKNNKSLYLSWKKWKNSNIDVLLFENNPITGFCIGDYSNIVSHNIGQSIKTYIRLVDYRGFEFEITTENFLTILKTCTIKNNKIDGNFVYAYNHYYNDLYLLSTDSDEYKLFNSDEARIKYAI